MKRIQPTRYSGRFLCLDSMNHGWFWSTLKTLIHSLSVYFSNKKLKKKIQKKFQAKLSFLKKSEEPRITWIGHSTFLIQMAGKNILTDPILGSLSSIFRRIIPAVAKVADLPQIDYVLISHNHFDHMDAPTLKKIKKRFPLVKVLAPMGDKGWFDHHGFKNSSEHSWWDEIIDPFIKDLKFTFLPANHWSQRTLFDKNRSLWGSWMIQLSKFKIYFAGDTSWGAHFEQIGNHFQDIDVACLPIGPGEPRSWMKETHINAREAVKAFINLRARNFLPMHWGTYHLGFDEFYTPLNLLRRSWKEFRLKLKGKRLKFLKFGEMLKDVQFILSQPSTQLQKD